MENSKYAKLLFLCDIIFCILFIYAFWIEKQHAAILGLILIIAIITIYPLWCYAFNYMSIKEYEKNIKWNISYKYLVIFYAISRCIFLIIFIFIAIVDKANIDFAELSKELSTLTVILIGIMIILVSSATFFALKLSLHHNELFKKGLENKQYIFNKVLGVELIPCNDSNINAEDITQVYYEEKNTNNNNINQKNSRNSLL